MTNVFFLDNRGLLYLWARRYRHLLEGRAALDMDDLLQAGALGLMEALDTYQPDKGAWSTWASYHIRNAMLDALGLRRRKSDPFVVSLDAPVYTDDGEPSEITLLETIADPNNPDMDEMLLEDEIVQTVRAAVAALPEDQREVTRLHELEGKTLKACAERLNLAHSEVRKVHGRALRQLRKDRKIRALAIDQETAYHRHKGVLSFHNSMSSVVEDLVLWRMERERLAGL